MQWHLAKGARTCPPAPRQTTEVSHPPYNAARLSLFLPSPPEPLHLYRVPCICLRLLCVKSSASPCRAFTFSCVCPALHQPSSICARHSPRSNPILLFQLLRHRRGVPLSLAVLYCCVAARLGLGVRPVRAASGQEQGGGSVAEGELQVVRGGRKKGMAEERGGHQGRGHVRATAALRYVGAAVTRDAVAEWTAGGTVWGRWPG